MTLTKELPSSTSLLRTHTGLRPRTTRKAITKPDTNIPNRRWNTPIKLRNGRRRLIKSPQNL
jgi:hypothetical protein